MTVAGDGGSLDDGGRWSREIGANSRRRPDLGGVAIAAIANPPKYGHRLVLMPIPS